MRLIACYLRFVMLSIMEVAMLLIWVSLSTWDICCAPVIRDGPDQLGVAALSSSNIEAGTILTPHSRAKHDSDHNFYIGMLNSRFLCFGISGSFLRCLLDPDCLLCCLCWSRQSPASSSSSLITPLSTSLLSVSRILLLSSWLITSPSSWSSSCPASELCL